MKTISLYTFILVALIKSIASFSCEDVYLDSKETLYKAISQEKVIEKNYIRVQILLNILLGILIHVVLLKNNQMIKKLK